MCCKLGLMASGSGRSGSQPYTRECLSCKLGPAATAYVSILKPCRVCPSLRPTIMPMPQHRLENACNGCSARTAPEEASNTACCLQEMSSMLPSGHQARDFRRDGREVISRVQPPAARCTACRQSMEMQSCQNKRTTRAGCGLAANQLAQGRSRKLLKPAQCRDNTRCSCAWPAAGRGEALAAPEALQGRLYMMWGGAGRSAGEYAD